jgi:hypothetical protein
MLVGDGMDVCDGVAVELGDGLEVGAAVSRGVGELGNNTRVAVAGGAAVDVGLGSAVAVTVGETPP